MLGHPQLQTGMPSRPVQHQHDLLLWACSHRAGKGVEFNGKQLQIHAGRQMENASTGGGMHETHQIAPVVAMLDWRNGPLAVKAPDLLQDGLEPEPVLIHGPQLHLGRGVELTEFRGHL